MSPVETYDAACNEVSEGRFLCNVVVLQEGYGRMVGTGIAQFYDPEYLTGDGDYVLVGGTDKFAGYIGKSTSKFGSHSLLL